jgi:hypothetical protein
MISSVTGSSDTLVGRLVRARRTPVPQPEGRLCESPGAPLGDEYLEGNVGVAFLKPVPPGPGSAQRAHSFVWRVDGRQTNWRVVPITLPSRYKFKRIQQIEQKQENRPVCADYSTVMRKVLSGKDIHIGVDL